MFILQKVLLTRKVKVVENVEPTIIGTWFWAKKIPNCVNGKFHNPVVAITLQVLMSFQIFVINPVSLKFVMRRIRSLNKQSRIMNKEIRKRKVL